MNKAMRRIVMVAAVIGMLGAGVCQATALGSERDTPQRPGTYLSLTMASNVIIYAGSLVCVNSNGLAEPAADTAGFAVVGRAEATVDNRTAVYLATRTIKLARGVFRWANADSIAAADINKIVYVTDDQTVNKTGGGQNIIAGTVIDVDSSGVWVDTAKIGPIGAATPSSLAVSGNGTIGGTLGVTGAATLTGNAIANELDARTATALLIGKATATSVTIGASDAPASIPGNATITGTLGVSGATTVSNFTATGSVTLPAGSVSGTALADPGVGTYTNAAIGFTNVFDAAGRLVSHDP